MRLEETKGWKAIRKDLMSATLVDVAKLHEVNAGLIAAAIKRTGFTREAIRSHEDLPPEPSEGRKKGPSKAHLLEPYEELLGKEPDAAIARKAGVSTRTVATYRQRKQIPGYNRWLDDSRSRKQTRRSAIDPYKEFVGVETDAEVAKRAGVTAQAVRNYRSKLGIVAAKRRKRSGSESRLGTTDAWRVEFEGQTAVVARIVSAASLDEALSTSRSAGLGAVVGISKIGQML